MPEIKFKHFDKWRKDGTIKGIFLGGCVDRGDGSSFRRKAHAHTRTKINQGWICVRSRHRLMNDKGKPSLLMWHELAHLISKQGHTNKWRKTMRELCGRVWPNHVAHPRRRTSFNRIVDQRVRQMMKPDYALS